MEFTTKDHVIDENEITGIILAIVYDIAVIKPDYANGKDGYEYLMHISRIEPYSESGDWYEESA